LFYYFYYFVYITDYFIVGKSYNLKALLLKVCCTLLVFHRLSTIMMIPSVKFYNKPAFKSNEISNVCAYYMLPSKIESQLFVV